MSKPLKNLKKDIKKCSKHLNSDKGLTVKKTFDVTTSFYGHGKENKPYMTIGAKGDFKISVLKLVLIIIGVISAVSLVLLGIKGLISKCRSKKYRDRDDQLDDELWV
ncbi:MAG: hypothetical protein HFE63_06650 [Clostridiales bacterium]|nr:hypothetical protein [Clostridiales bacterium]